MSAKSAAKPWWQQATALVTVSTGGVVTGLTFAPGTAAAMTSPDGMPPVHLMALEKAASLDHVRTAGAGQAPSGDEQLRPAVVNVAKYYLQLARTRTPEQVNALIWGKDSIDGADHGDSCAAFASLTLELGAQAVGQRSWVSGGGSYPWPVHSWADPRVDENPASPQITSVMQDAEAHGRWHALGDGYQPQPGDWVLFDEHVEVVTSSSGGELHTIGADSLPGYTINEHTFSGPLSGHGVAGFVDNGNLARADEPAKATPAPQAAPQGKSAPRREAAPQAAAPQEGAVPQKGKAPRVPAGQATIPGSVAPVPAASQAPAPSPEATAHAAAAVIPGPATGTPAAGGVPGASGPVGPGHPASSGRPASSSGPASSGHPGGGGHYARHTPSVSPQPTGSQAQREFIDAVAPGAMAAQQRWGVPASVTIAQAIEESDWGSSQLAAVNHNLFGIKGSGPAGSAYYPTQEFEGGQWVTVNAAFRAYRNIAESISDHAELLATSGHYDRAMADRHVPDAFASALTGVYATDPNYGSNLIATMKLYNLYQYDTATSPVTKSHPAPPAAPAPAARPAASRPQAPQSPQAGARPAEPQPTRQKAPRPEAPRTQVPRPQKTAPPAGRARPGTGSRAGSPAGNASIPGVTATPLVPAKTAARYETPLPQATAAAYFTSARVPVSRSEHLYRDVASRAGISWKLLAACDWMQCQSDPRRSPVHGEKLGTVNRDGSAYATKSAALAQCASDMIQLADAVYGIDLTVPRPMSVRALAEVFAAFRWGGLLARYGVSAMEFPYSVAGLTEGHARMHWPAIGEKNAPDRPGSRFRQPFGAVPVLLSLKYPATV